MIDFIIVGQGLAGTILAHKLLSKSYQIKVIDNGHLTASSKVAAGIINPITGRRFVKSWLIDLLIPEAISSYESIEAKFGIHLISKLNIIRALTSIKHENDWYMRFEDPEYSEYMIQKAILGDYQNSLKGQLVYGEIKNSYQIDIKLMIESYQDFLADENRLINESFNFSQLERHEDYVNYNGLRARRIIFCEGYKAIDNPYFSYLPFEPVKGEVVKFESDAIPRDRMLRHDQYIVPMTDGGFWSGGGYDKVNLDDQPTNLYFERWQSDVHSFLNTDIQVTERLAGVRPAVKGRRPIVGGHARHSNVYLFNGMGTKGTSLAPYCAEQLINNISNGHPLNPEIDIRRFDVIQS